MLRNIHNLTVCCMGASFIASCAATPNVETGYYDAKASVVIKFTQTAKCKTVNNQQILIRETDFSVTPSYSANRTETAYHTLKFSKLDGFLTNTDVTVTYYDDGRLKGLNTKQAGQAGPIIKSIVDLAAAIAKAAAPTPAKDDCDFLSAMSSDPVTVVYEGKSSFDENDKIIELTPKNISKTVLENNLNTIFDVPSVDYAVDKATSCSAKSDYQRQACDLSTSKRGHYPLSLVQPALVTLNLNVNDDEYGTSKVLVPQLGKSYTLPVPKAPLFGENRFGLALSEAGTPTSIGYGASSGIAEVFTGATSVAGAVGGASTAEKAAAVKAEADLIAQQKRLVRCRADDANC